MALVHALFWLATACNLGELVKQAGEIREDVKTEIGVDANVKVNTQNGKKSVVIVLTTKPPGDLEVAKAKAMSIAKRRVPDAAQVVVQSAL